ncbi:DUF2461 domain-containing protein [uncultured Flavonifractor sp.]|uniref:DUF2461 domain-containing protein n=1 Tax=uncultured Flavonifractor sp. TaxID=1193534 RepID=UPI002620B9AA|nr:DUF2461 domain-containing protein [uncultured Flavonifractor sp.]
MFQGFSGATVDFLWGIRFNNERGWFEAHKEEYRTHLLEPMKALSGEVYERFSQAHKDLPLICKVSRIYRDARRLFGRGPYKDHLWMSLHRPHEAGSFAPVFWFELTPDSWSCGMGFWQAPPLTMAKFRARMDRDPGPMETLTRRLARQDRFVLEGPEYKRPKAAPSPLLAPWYAKKSFSLCQEGEHCDLLWSHDLVDALVEGYEFLLPYYQYMELLEGDPDPRGE